MFCEKLVEMEQWFSGISQNFGAIKKNDDAIIHTMDFVFVAYLVDRGQRGN